MTDNPAYANLALAWVLFLLGILAGFILGINFHRENWLGGYGSLKRRLYRLAHIAFFGLGILNLLFFFTAQHLTWSSGDLTLASRGFLAGGLTMSPGCIVMAHFPKARAVFLIPVLSLATGVLITLWEVFGL